MFAEYAEFNSMEHVLPASFLAMAVHFVGSCTPLKSLISNTNQSISVNGKCGHSFHMVPVTVAQSPF